MTIQRETGRAVQAFDEYCALGPDRSLIKLRAHLLKTWPKGVPALKTLKDWSASHNWQERVRQYELGEAERRRKRRTKAVEDMNDRHAMLAVNAQKQMLEQIQRLITAQKFGSQATVMLLKLATDLERLARGEAQSKIEVAGDAERPLTIKTVWDRALLNVAPQEEEPAQQEVQEQGESND